MLNTAVFVMGGMLALHCWLWLVVCFLGRGFDFWVRIGVDADWLVRAEEATVPVVMTVLVSQFVAYSVCYVVLLLGS